MSAVSPNLQSTLGLLMSPVSISTITEKAATPTKRSDMDSAIRSAAAGLEA